MQLNMSYISNNLTEETITFGKYKNSTLEKVLKDRSYCCWLIQQDWFKNNYEFLYNRVRDYNPINYFIKSIPPVVNNKDHEKDHEKDHIFITTYMYFNLISLDDIKIHLSDEEKKCYLFYFEMINILKSKILNRIEEGYDNIYDIKAPVKWLQNFEKKYDMKRDIFKTFIASYDLPNITNIIEDIKKQGGIEYKGAKSFIIAKDRSLKQEKWWEGVLKKRYGEDIASQFKYENCIFDFLNISTNTIFECKLSLKDFNEEQHYKYKIILEKYRIIYLIDKDCIIWLDNKIIYTTDYDKYDDYIFNLKFSNKISSYLDDIIREFKIIKVNDLSILFSK